MKKILLAILAISISLCSDAQTKKPVSKPKPAVKPVAKTVTPAPLKKTLVLKTSDYESGNGASVVWHPLQKKYYAARAGNSTFPMDVFNAAGKRISPEGLETQFDIRGLWYDNVKKRICTNGYDDYGWAYYSLTAFGMPDTVTVFCYEILQPSENSVGCFDPKTYQVYFLDGTKVLAYGAGGDDYEEDYIEKTTLLVGPDEATASSITELPEGYNPTPVFTGIPGKEIGLLNAYGNQVELYSLSTGKRTGIRKFPENTTLVTIFNFAYTNGMYFIFDKDNMQWVGYK
ncbi:MAG: hypothetical protein JNJ58_08135 [Chitinophagaceae bacterium]|nr:hypothetical protein [Chitinophagaceae bacterium]